MQRRGDQYVYTQRVGAPTGRDVGDVGWRGNELVAFRMHLPARILYHDAPSNRWSAATSWSGNRRSPIG